MPRQERILATLPDHLDRGSLVNSRSEGNELAIRLVRTATGRANMVGLDHGYHGNTATLIDVSPWAFERYNIEPDVVTMGKPTGNGQPLAVVATTRAIAAAFNNGMGYFNTLN